MVGTRPPGCTDCPKTPHGGRQLNVAEGDGLRLEVRHAGRVIGRFRSVRTATSFMAGKPGATLHPATTAHTATDGPVPD